MRTHRTAALTLLCLACTQAPPGRKLASGIARGLVARDGAVAFLLDAAHPDEAGVPDDLLAGDLWLDARKLGAGVSTQEGGYVFAPNGTQLAWLARWRFREGIGELWVASPASEPRRLAARARSFAWSKSGVVGWVGEDRVGIGERTVALRGVQAVQWSPDGQRLAARASAAAGGRLWVVDKATLGAREVALGTSDFAFGADGTLAALGPPPPQGGDRPLLVEGVRVAAATAFAFSPDGKDLALLSTSGHPGEASGQLYRVPRAGGTPQLVGSRVADWRWDSAGDLLCLARYDLRARAGTLTVSRSGEAPRELATRVQGFSVFGGRVLYLAQAPQKGDFRLELWAVDLDAQAPAPHEPQAPAPHRPEALAPHRPQALAPHRIDEGVYGWQLSGDAVYYKARCAGGPRTCSLLRAPFDGGAAEQLAPEVAGFELSTDGSRILVQRPHRGAPRSVDLGVIAAAGAARKDLKFFVEEADPSSLFADGAGKRVAYAVIAAGKGGVFLADVP